MHVFHFPKRRGTAFAMLCLIGGLLAVATFGDGTNRRNSLLPAQPKATENLTVNDPRPVAEAVWQLEKKYGWIVTYEDPIYINSNEIADVTLQVRRDLDQYKPGEAPKVFIPKGGELSISFYLNPDTGRPVEPPETVVQRLLDANSAVGYAGKFRLESNRRVMHIIPTGYKDISGAVISHPSILDSIITIPAQERTGLQSLELLCDAVSLSARMKMRLGTLDRNLFGNSRNRIGVNRVKARVFLMRTLETVNLYAGHSWQLFYDPTMKNYALNIHPVSK